MDLKRALNSIGKSAFIKYYYNFKNMSREYCISNFEENYTHTAKVTRTNYAKRIFSEGKQLEALKIIIQSKRVDELTHTKAIEILNTETK